MTIRLHVHESFGVDTQPPPWFRGRRAYSERRDPVKVIGWCWHQTAVAGGFGAPDFEARVARYAGTSMGRRGVPYHYVYSPQDAALVALCHPVWYSYHGHKANSYTIGIAIDSKLPEDGLDIGALAQAWQLAIEHVEGFAWSPFVVEAHRQHSAGRGDDPGELAWPTIESVALVSSIEARPEHTTGDGRPIPDSWRPALAPPSLGCDHPTMDLAAMPTNVYSRNVSLVQGLLLGWGYGPDGLIDTSTQQPDGYPGGKTETAMRGFRTDRGLSSTAVVDDDAWGALLP